MRPSLIIKADQGGVREAGEAAGLEVHLATLGWLQFEIGRILQGWSGGFLCGLSPLEAVGDGAPGCRGGRLSSLGTAYGHHEAEIMSHTLLVCASLLGMQPALQSYFRFNVEDLLNWLWGRKGTV